MFIVRGKTVKNNTTMITETNREHGLDAVDGVHE